ncbi:NTP transferase domain-containing protein [Aeromonas allosaccharophila]|uniref:NTP transferase domain-containing protein n=1 Tax=Aeromonas allosaccharophila TaxID=656 RepID=UPI003988A0B5
MNIKSTVDQVIVLAAGKSLQLDGVCKLMIRHPVTGLTIMDYICDAFKGKKIVVVVGYKAVEIMQSYPDLDYVYNPNWALTNNAMSLALALDDKPTYVVSGDIFISSDLIKRLDSKSDDMVLTSCREKRSLTAIHCVLDDKNSILETYQGPVRDMQHPESIGLFKVTSSSLLREWRRRCLLHSNLFVGQLIPCEVTDLSSVSITDEFFYEINTPTDYMKLVEESRIE